MQQNHIGSSKLHPKTWSSCQSTLHPSGQGHMEINAQFHMSLAEDPSAKLLLGTETPM